MSPKYSVYVTRWEVHRIRHVEAQSTEEAEERGREQFENKAESEQTDGGIDNVEAEIEEE